MTVISTPDRAEVDRRAVFAVCGAFGMTRAERLNLATTFFNREVTSYRHLSRDEWRLLRSGLECAALVCALQMDRRRNGNPRGLIQ